MIEMRLTTKLTDSCYPYRCAHLHSEKNRRFKLVVEADNPRGGTHVDNFSLSLKRNELEDIHKAIGMILEEQTTPQESA